MGGPSGPDACTMAPVLPIPKRSPGIAGKEARPEDDAVKTTRKLGGFAQVRFDLQNITVIEFMADVCPCMEHPSFSDGA